MNVGKLSELILKRSVINKFRNKRAEVISGARAGGDAAIMQIDGRLVTAVSCSTEGDFFNPREMCLSHILTDARITAIRAVNSVSAEGGSPFALLIAMILPPTIEEKEMKQIMETFESVAKELNLQIAGGHSEVSRKVCQPVFTVTAYGNGAVKITDKKEEQTLYGKDIVMTGYTALEGSGVVAVKNRRQLEERFAPGYLDKAKGYLEQISISEHARIAMEHNASVMHDLSETGVFGGLWELGEKLRSGLEIHVRKIPVLQETIELSEYMDLNPYTMQSSGSLLVVAEDGNGLVETYREAGIHAAVIGKVTEGNDRVLLNQEERRFLEQPRS